jgi:hypothetical protein
VAFLARLLSAESSDLDPRRFVGIDGSTASPRKPLSASLTSPRLKPRTERVPGLSLMIHPFSMLAFRLVSQSLRGPSTCHATPSSEHRFWITPDSSTCSTGSTGVRRPPRNRINGRSRAGHDRPSNSLAADLLLLSNLSEAHLACPTLKADPKHDRVLPSTQVS